MFEIPSQKTEEFTVTLTYAKQQFEKSKLAQTQTA
jgi:hypothetical protein